MAEMAEMVANSSTGGRWRPQTGHCWVGWVGLCRSLLCGMLYAISQVQCEHFYIDLAGRPLRDRNDPQTNNNQTTTLISDPFLSIWTHHRSRINKSHNNRSNNRSRSSLNRAERGGWKPIAGNCHWALRCWCHLQALLHMTQPYRIPHLLRPQQAVRVVELEDICATTSNVNVILKWRCDGQMNGLHEPWWLQRMAPSSIIKWLSTRWKGSTSFSRPLSSM